MKIRHSIAKANKLQEEINYVDDLIEHLESKVIFLKEKYSINQKMNFQKEDEKEEKQKQSVKKESLSESKINKASSPKKLSFQERKEIVKEKEKKYSKIISKEKQVEYIEISSISQENFEGILDQSKNNANFPNDNMQIIEATQNEIKSVEIEQINDRGFSQLFSLFPGMMISNGYFDEDDKNLNQYSMGGGLCYGSGFSIVDPKEYK